MYPHDEFNTFGPLGYLISFRCYGPWLHGDQRGSMDRFHNRYGTPKLQVSPQRENYEKSLLKSPLVKLNAERRRIVEHAIRETCK